LDSTLDDYPPTSLKKTDTVKIQKFAIKDYYQPPLDPVLLFRSTQSGIYAASE
jgi:hypothetical protein